MPFYCSAKDIKIDNLLIACFLIELIKPKGEIKFKNKPELKLPVSARKKKCEKLSKNFSLNFFTNNLFELNKKISSPKPKFSNFKSKPKNKKIVKPKNKDTAGQWRIKKLEGNKQL